MTWPTKAGDWRCHIFLIFSLNSFQNLYILYIKPLFFIMSLKSPGQQRARDLRCRHQSRGFQAPSLCSSASSKTDKSCENNAMIFFWYVVYMINGCLVCCHLYNRAVLEEGVPHCALVVVTSIEQQSIWILLPHLLNRTKCQSREEISSFSYSLNVGGQYT